MAKAKQQKPDAAAAAARTPRPAPAVPAFAVPNVLPVARAATADTPAGRPGAVLRALRVRNGWTLAEVSQRTGLNISTLSKLENNKVSFSYDRLVQVAVGLNVDIEQLVSAEAPASPAAAAAPGSMAQRRTITRAGEGVMVESGTYVTNHLATELLSKTFVPMVGEIHARTLEEFGPLIRHPGEEFIYVLGGVLELHTELYAPTRLYPGDSMYFDSEMGHAYLSVGDDVCRMMCICSERRK